MFKQLSPVDKIVGTSVDDARSSISAMTDLKLAKECLRKETMSMKRATMVKLLQAKIRKLEKGGDF